MDQDKIENCIQRVRMARNIGMSFAETMDGFADLFTKEEIFFAWCGACILDKNEDERVLASK